MPAIVRILVLSLSFASLGACNDAPRANREGSANQVSAVKPITGPVDAAATPSPLLPTIIEPKPLVKVPAGGQATMPPRLSSQRLPRAIVESDAESPSEAAALTLTGVSAEFVQASPADQNTGAVRAREMELVIPISAPRTDLPEFRVNSRPESMGSLADG